MKDIEKFFECAANAIQQEELELNNLLGSNSQYYEQSHFGVYNLYETTYVYIIFKALLKNYFEHMVYWEYPYPSNSNLHSDIAFLDKNRKLEALIEFKLWTQEDDRVIQSDIDKLRKEKNCNRYIFIIGYGGDIKDNDTYLHNHNHGIHNIALKNLITKYYDQNLGKLVDGNLGLYLYEVL